MFMCLLVEDFELAPAAQIRRYVPLMYGMREIS
jgi:hypothetical protein